MNLSILGFHVAGDVVVLGLITGMLYGILATGLVLVYRSSRIINFAHGDIGGFGAALLGEATRAWGAPYWLAFIIALGASGLIGAASEVLVIRRLSGSPLIISVIATLGLGQLISIFSGIVDVSVGSGITYPQPPGFPQFNVGALLMTPAYTAMLFLTPFIVGGLAVFLRRGRLGIAMRAASANPDAARMSGMLAGRLSALAWGIAGVVAAYTAILVLPTRGFSGGQFLGPGLLLRGLVCAVVASMTSLPIALGAGLGLGVVEALLLANYPTGGQVEMVMFVIILVALLFQRSTSGRREDKGLWMSTQAFPTLPMSFLKVPAIRRMGWIVAGAATTVALTLPLLVSNSDATTLTFVLAFGTIGLSLILVTGLGGQLSLGQFAVAGVGAVASYQVTNAGAPFVVGVAAAAIAGAAISLVIGLPSLRIRGLMLAVTTLAFALAAESWLFQQPWMLGEGVQPEKPRIFGFSFDTGKSYYMVALAISLVAFWLVRNLWASGTGRRMRAVRDNEDAARSFTIPPAATKLQMFVVGGVVAGLGGAIFGHSLASLAANGFTVDTSINTAVETVIGGIGLVAGPLLGSLYLIGLPTFVQLDNVGAAAISAGWLFLILRYPGGIGQALAPWRERLVDVLARKAGLDPVLERTVTPGGGIAASTAGLQAPSSGPAVIPPGEVLLRAEGVTRRFGGLTAVDDVSVDVRSGEILGLIGPNGAGKTTFFELLGGFTSLDAGRILFAGHDVSSVSPERRAQLGLIRSFQDAALFPTMTVHEVVMLSMERSQPTSIIRSVLGVDSRAERRRAERADELISVLGLSSYRDLKIAALSTGTRRITELACLVALEPVLLLLDEPTSGIAQRESEALGDVILNIKNQLDLTLVIIEHDIPLLMSLADRVVALESGRVVTVGTPAEVQANEQVIASYLGTDSTAIERSDRSATMVGPVKCGAPTKSGAPCQRPAGPEGPCAAHTKAAARSAR